MNTEAAHICYPRLFRSLQDQVLNEIRIAPKAVLAVGRMDHSRLRMLGEPKLAHQSTDPLAVDVVAFPIQLRRQATITIRRPLGGKSL